MDAEAIRELFAAFGPVTVRRMFGGAGIFAEGMCIAIVVDSVIYLKTDDQTAAGFEAEGLQPFSYRTGSGKRTVMSFWRMPDRLYDDPDELVGWARAAFGAAQRSKSKPKPKSKIKTKPKSKPSPKPATSRRKRPRR
jgi:DNA transformation protein and related proteins